MNDISMLDTKTFPLVSQWQQSDQSPAPASVSDMMANLTEESQQAPGTHKAKEAVHQAIRWVGYFSFWYWLM